MPTPSKTVSQLKREGTYRADRHAQRGDEPVALGQIDDVEWGEDQYARWMWERLLPMAEQVGAGEIDTAALAGCCQWYARFREGMERLAELDQTAVMYNRVQTSTNTAWKQFVEMAREYGLSPRARMQLARPVEEDAEIDPLEALQAEMN
jgi:P27 family predicted phage terminase small subunit